MRPTPAETIAGVRRILRDVVEPEVGSEYARARLREIRAVLAQVDWNDAALRMRAETETHQHMLREIDRWAAADPERREQLGTATMPPLPTSHASFAELAEVHTAVAGHLTEAVDRLAAWCRAHPTDREARDLRTHLINTLAPAS